MGKTDIIDIRRFHKSQILQPMFTGSGTTDIRMFIMTVYATQFDSLPVDSENTTCRWNLPEPDSLRTCMCHLPFFNKLNTQIIKIRILSIPMMRWLNTECQTYFPIRRNMSGYCQLPPGNFLPFFICKGKSKVVWCTRTWIITRHCTFLFVTDHNPQFQIRIFKPIIEKGLCDHIIYPTSTRHSFQSDIPVNSAQCPVVKNIKFILFSYLPYTDCQQIRPVCFQLAADIKRKRRITAVMPAQKLPVQPDFRRWPHPAEMKQYTLPIPAFRSLEFMQIKALTSLVFLEPSIYRFLISQNSPIGRYRDLCEFLTTESRRTEIFQTFSFLFSLCQGKLPFAVQANILLSTYTEAW